MRSEVFREDKKLDLLLERAMRKSSEQLDIILRFELEGYPKESIEKIVQCVKKYIGANYRPKVSVKADELKLTSSELIDFIDLEDDLKKENVEFCLAEENDEYSLDQTITAFLKCKDFAEFVKNTDASPFEKYLMIYRFVTDRVYNDSEESVGKPRNLISILTGDEIVCVGYAKLLSFLCNEVGIRCEGQTMDIIYADGSDNGRHRNNIIYLKDEKYGIDGCYYADACWDSIKEKECPFLKYTHAFIPISDVEKMKGLYFKFDSNHLLYSDHSEIDYIADVEGIKEYANFMNIPLKELESDVFKQDFMSILSTIQPYMDFVSDILKKNEIPADIISNEKFEKIPNKFSPEFLVAMAMLEPPRMDIIEQSIEEMKVFYQSGGKLDAKTEGSRIFRDRGYNDIYATLKEKESIDSIMSVFDVGYYLGNYFNYPLIADSINQLRTSSNPISLKSFKDACRTSFEIEGLSPENAVKATRIATARTCNRSKARFEEGAINCFVADGDSDLEIGKGE